MDIPPEFEGSFTDPVDIQRLIDMVVEAMDDADWVWVHMMPSQADTQRVIEMHIVVKNSGELVLPDIC